MTFSSKLFSTPHPASTTVRKSSVSKANPSDSGSAFDEVLTAARQPQERSPAASDTPTQTNTPRPVKPVDASKNKDSKASVQDGGASASGDCEPNAQHDSGPSERVTSEAESDSTDDSPKLNKPGAPTGADANGVAGEEIALQAAVTTPGPPLPVAPPVAAIQVKAATGVSASGKPVDAIATNAADPIPPGSNSDPHLAKPSKQETPHVAPKTPATPGAQAAAIEAKAPPATVPIKVDNAGEMTSASPSPLAAVAPVKPHLVAKKDGSSQNSDATPDPAAQTSSPSSTALASAAEQTIASPAAPSKSLPTSGVPEKPDAAPIQNVSSIGAAPVAKSSTGTDRASSAGPAQDSPAPDQSSAFDQIVLGLRAKLDARNGKAEIRLDPPNLGTVRVSVNLDRGNLTAQFQSSSDVVRELLKSNMEKLKTVLESQGITVDKLAVESTVAKPFAAPILPAANSAANDGRSGGQYQQHASDQRRSQKESSGFSRVWQDAAKDSAPIDLVA